MKQNTNLHRYRLCELRKFSVLRCTSTSSCSWLLFLATLVIPDNFEGSVVLYSKDQTASTIFLPSSEEDGNKSLQVLAFFKKAGRR